MGTFFASPVIGTKLTVFRKQHSDTKFMISFKIKCDVTRIHELRIVHRENSIDDTSGRGEEDEEKGDIETSLGKRSENKMARLRVCVYV